MRALTYAEPQGAVTVRDLPDVVAPAGGAVVEVAATGLCRSDWHGWMGHDADIVHFPHVPGHEFAGTVTSVGDGVDPRWLGRRVTAPFVYACGTCATCREGNGQVCPRQQQPGFSLPGSHAEQVVVVAAQTNLIEVPESLDLGLAAGLGCRVATSYRAVVSRARLAADEWLAVFGCGGVGLAAIAIGRSLGARVVAVDVDEGSLARAAEVGATAVLRAGPDTVQQLVDLTAGGAHVALDALGSPATFGESILALRRRGRQVQVGLLPEPPRTPMGRVIAYELDLLGSHGMAAADYPALLADVTAGRLDLAALHAPEPPMSLADAATALPAMGRAASTGIRLIDPHR